MVKEKNKTVPLLLWVLAGALAVWVACLYWIGGGPAEMTVEPLDAAAIGGETAVLDLNEAGLAELEALPGIGPVLAERILDWRGQNGPFDAPEDVMDVPGIGPAKYEAIAPYLTG